MDINDVLHFLDQERIDYKFFGNKSAYIESISSINNLKFRAICWIKNIDSFSENLENLLKEKECVLVSPFKIEGINCIVSPYPKRTYFAILNHFYGSAFKHTIDPSAVVLTKRIGKEVHIGANCFINSDVVIGDNTVIHPSVSIISKCIIGSDCTISPGTVIGSDGFGYYYDDNGNPVKVRHFGGVRIGDRVEIGANTCIDRGTIDDTVICDDVKIDNLVHIAHNAYLEHGSMIVAGALICGSAKLEQQSYIAPGGIVKNQLDIGENSLVGLGAVVTRNVLPNTVVAGVPAKEIRSIMKGDK